METNFNFYGSCLWPGGGVEKWRGEEKVEGWKNGCVGEVAGWRIGGGLTERCGGGEECVSIWALKQKQYGEKE